MPVRLNNLPKALGNFALVAGSLLASGALRAAEADINRDLLPGAPARDLAAPRLSVPTAPSDQWRKDLMKEVTEPQNSMPIPLPTTTPNRFLTREKEEQLDKRRNWIFVSPEDAVTKPSEALRIRDDNSTEPYRTVMLQFLDQNKTGVGGDAKTNRSDSTSGKSGTDEKGNSKSVSDRQEDARDHGKLKGDLELGNWGRREDPLSIRALGGSSNRDTNDSRDGTASNSISRSGMDTAASNGPAFSISNGTLADRVSAVRDRRDQHDERQLRNQEFQDLLNRRAYPNRPDTSTGGAADPINMLTDSSVSALNAISSRGMNVLPTTPSINATLPSPTSRIGSGPGLPESPNRGFVPGATSSTSVAPPPKPVHTPKPAILEIPRRKL